MIGMCPSGCLPLWNLFCHMIFVCLLCWNQYTTTALLQETFQEIWSATERYVRLLFNVVRIERRLEVKQPHKHAFVRQLRTLLDSRVKQFVCQMKTTMIAAGFPRRRLHYKHSQPGCNMDTIPTSIIDKTQVVYTVLRAFVDDFLGFCLTYF